MHGRRPQRSPLRGVLSALAITLAGVCGVPGQRADAQATSSIDVLVVYPRPAATQLASLIQWNRSWGETEMGPFLDAAFARVTEIYQQSGVAVDFRVVHFEQIDLSSIAADWEATLSLALMNSELGNPVYEPYLEAIETLRDAHAADVVVYWRQPGDGGPTSNGAGSIGGGEDEAYVHLTYGGITPTIAAHELGHLLGGEHADGVQESATYSIDDDAGLLREYRTVMTIAVPLDLADFRYIWRFSSPGASVTAAIDCSTLSGSLETCNFNTAAPLGNASHDAVASLSAMAPVVASFRTPTPSVPVPTATALFRGLAVLLIGWAGLHRLPTQRAHA